MKPENIIRNKGNNRFEPVYKIWSLNDFDEGYVLSHHNRFMVRIPEHHRANATGWIFRSIAAYEAYHPGEMVTKEFAIHHKDENRLNDSKENLEKMLFGDHTRHHCKGRSNKEAGKKMRTGAIVKCNYCGKEFYRAPWETSKTNFCSKFCWYTSRQRKVICKYCNKEFIVPKSRKIAKFCSKLCWHNFIERKNNEPTI